MVQHSHLPTGGRAKEDIIGWLKKKTGSRAVEYKTMDDLTKLNGSNNVVVIGDSKMIILLSFLCLCTEKVSTLYNRLVDLSVYLHDNF